VKEQQTSDAHESSQVLLKCEGELQRRFGILMKYYGLTNNTELVRILINEKYRQAFPKEA